MAKQRQLTVGALLQPTAALGAHVAIQYDQRPRSGPAFARLRIIEQVKPLHLRQRPNSEMQGTLT